MWLKRTRRGNQARPRKYLVTPPDAAHEIRRELLQRLCARLDRRGTALGERRAGDGGGAEQASRRRSES